MDSKNDSQLISLLREWKVETPASFTLRVMDARQPWWQFLLSGSIRVPVPVAPCLLALTLAGAWRQTQLMRSTACPSSATNIPVERQVPCPADSKC